MRKMSNIDEVIGHLQEGNITAQIRTAQEVLENAMKEKNCHLLYHLYINTPATIGGGIEICFNVQDSRIPPGLDYPPKKCVTIPYVYPNPERERILETAKNLGCAWAENPPP